MKIFTRQFCFASLLLTLFCHFQSAAQNLRINAYTQNGIDYRDSLWFTPEEYFSYSMGNINLSEVINSSGFLIEKSQNPFGADKFDGRNNDDDTIKSTSQGVNIYSKLYLSSVTTNNIVSPEELVLAAEAILAQGKVPILLLNQSYHRLKDDALIQGLFTTNADSTILYDNPNRTSSPFSKRRVFVGGPYIKNSAYESNGEVKFFITPPSLSLTDTIGGDIQIDFDDGNGYQLVTANSEKVIRYSSSGIKFIKILQGGLLTISQLNYIKNDVYNEFTEMTGGSQQRSFSVAGAQVFEFLGCDGILDKPILILEGFNISGQQDANQLYGTLDRLESNRMLARLREINYDVMVVKLTENTGDILTNAQALERVINEINSTKNGTNKLHIIGLSMGGLIAKYCLKDMEDRAVDHQVENYFSYDSPHQGAYVPIGLQFLVLAANDAVRDIRLNPEFKVVYDALRSTAASQLLLLNTNMSVRNSFAATYANKGYPAQCHKFAIANGRGDAIGLNYPGNSQMMDLFATIKKGILGTVLRHSQKFWTTNTSNSLVTSFSNKGFAALFGFNGLKSRGLTVNYTGELVHETLPGSRDGLPSAHVIYGLGLAEAFRAQDQSSATVGFFGRESFTHVPTVSALDLNNQNYSQNGFYISRNPYYDVAANYSTIIQNQITPFEDFVFSANGSQSHLDISSTIADFIFTKINGSIPTYNCNSGCITNPPNFSTQFLGNACNEHEVTISNFPPGVGITWSVPPGVNLISGQGTNKVIITSGISGAINLSVSLSKPACTGILYNVPVTIQAPVVGAATNIAGPITALCTDQDYAFYIDPVPNATSYRWTTTYGEIFPPGNGTSITLNISASVSGPTPFTLSVEAINACGTGATYSEQYEFYDCTPGFKISPNPANHTMSIKPDQVQTNSTTGSKILYQSYSYKLYDKQGNILRQGKSDSKNEATIDTRSIPADNYFLHIIYPKETIKKQVIIQH